VDRRKNGCKRHLITDARGLPLVVVTTPANVRDEAPLVAMLDSLPPLPTASGRLRYLPGAVLGDRGYGFPWVIKQVVRRRIRSLLAPRGSPHGSGLGRVRYVVERTMSWMTGFRRLEHCFERSGEHWQALNELACCVICARRLRETNRQQCTARMAA
jgi:transposase